MSRTPDSTEAADLETTRRKIVAGDTKGIFVGLPQRKLTSRVPRSPQRCIQRKLPESLYLSSGQSSMAGRRPVSRTGPPADSIPEIAQVGRLESTNVPEPVSVTRFLSTPEVFDIMDSFLADHPEARELFVQRYHIPALPPPQEGIGEDRQPERPPSPPPDAISGHLHPLTIANCTSNSLQKRLSGLVTVGVKKSRQLCQTYLVTAGKVHRLEQMLAEDSVPKTLQVKLPVVHLPVSDEKFEPSASLSGDVASLSHKLFMEMLTKAKEQLQIAEKNFRDQFPMPSVEGFQMFREVVFKSKDNLMEQRFDNLMGVHEVSQSVYDFQIQQAYQDLCMQSRQATASIFEYLPKCNRNVREFLGIPGPDVPVVDTPEPTTRDLLAKIDQLTKTVASLQTKVSRGSSSQSRPGLAFKKRATRRQEIEQQSVQAEELAKIRTAIEKEAKEALSIIREVKEEVFCPKEVNFEAIFCRSEFLLLGRLEVQIKSIKARLPFCSRRSSIIRRCWNKISFLLEKVQSKRLYYQHQFERCVHFVRISKEELGFSLHLRNLLGLGLCFVPSTVSLCRVVQGVAEACRQFALSSSCWQPNSLA